MSGLYSEHLEGIIAETEAGLDKLKRAISGKDLIAEPDALQMLGENLTAKLKWARAELVRERSRRMVESANADLRIAELEAERDELRKRAHDWELRALGEACANQRMREYAEGLREALEFAHPPAMRGPHAAYAGSCGACEALAKPAPWDLSPPEDK